MFYLSMLGRENNVKNTNKVQIVPYLTLISNLPRQNYRRVKVVVGMRVHRAPAEVWIGNTAYIHVRHIAYADSFRSPSLIKVRQTHCLHYEKKSSTQMSPCVTMNPSKLNVINFYGALSDS